MNVKSSSLPIEHPEKIKALLCLFSIIIIGVSTILALVLAGYYGYSLFLAVLGGVVIRAGLRFAGRQCKNRFSTTAKEALDSKNNDINDFSAISLAKMLIIPLTMYALGYALNHLLS